MPQVRPSFGLTWVPYSLFGWPIIAFLWQLWVPRLFGCPILSLLLGKGGSKSIEDKERQGDHSSRPHITVRLQRPTRKLWRTEPARRPLRDVLPYLVLLRVGFSLPPPLLAARCALTAPFHPYPAQLRPEILTMGAPGSPFFWANLGLWPIIAFFWQLWESQLDGCPILSLLLGKGGKLNSSGAPGSPFFWANLCRVPKTSGSSWAGRYIFCGTFRKRPLKAAPRTLSGTPLYGVRTFLSQPAQPGLAPIVRRPAAITRPSS